VNNPLGSHSGVDNICGVYYTMPVIPQHTLSKLDYVFVVPFFFPKASSWRFQKSGRNWNKNKYKRRSDKSILHTLQYSWGQFGPKRCTTTSFKYTFYCRIENVQYHFLRKIQDALALNDLKATSIKFCCIFNFPKNCYAMEVKVSADTIS